MEKWSGDTWREGSAVAIALHHTDFSRLSVAMADRLSFMSPIVGYFTVFSQMAWVIILVLGTCTIVGVLTSETTNVFKRALLLCGIVIHSSIFILMDVGTFSLIVFVAYLGLLLDDDFRAIRERLNKRVKKPFIVLYDGRCGFCKKSVFVLSMLDWLHRLRFANFHDPENRKNYAPNLSLDALHTEMHVRLASGTYRKGFFAFRALAWQLPFLWVFAPFLFVPGASNIGSAIYRWVARKRI